MCDKQITNELIKTHGKDYTIKTKQKDTPSKTDEANTTNPERWKAKSTSPNRIEKAQKLTEQFEIKSKV